LHALKSPLAAQRFASARRRRFRDSFDGENREGARRQSHSRQSQFDPMPKAGAHFVERHRAAPRCCFHHSPSVDRWSADGLPMRAPAATARGTAIVAQFCERCVWHAACDGARESQTIRAARAPRPRATHRIKEGIMNTPDPTLAVSFDTTPPRAGAPDAAALPHHRRARVCALVLTLGLTGACAQQPLSEQAPAAQSPFVDDAVGSAGAGSATPVANAGQALTQVTESVGYVWADQLTTASYTPAQNYSMNSTGGANTVSRLGTGRYRVIMNGLASGGNAQVAAYGSTSNRCTLFSAPRPASGNLQIDVYCYTRIGDLSDTKFSVFYYQLSPVNATCLNASFGKISATATVSDASCLKSAARTATTGRYTLTMSAAFNAAQPPTFVTAISSTGAFCNPSNVSGRIVEVSCFNKSGARAWSDFEFLWLSLPDTMPTEIATAISGATSTNAVEGFYSVKGGFDMVFFDYGATGFQTVTFYGPGTNLPTTALVNAYSRSAVYCHPTGWFGGAAQASVSLACYDVNGTPSVVLSSVAVLGMPTP
jgi:hypothetical protein